MNDNVKPARLAIRAEALSKCYHLYARPVDRLRQLLWGRRRRYYREFWALRDASFELARGEVLGVVGRNGAGKSTLLQLVCGTLAPTSGAIAVEGRVAALLELGAGFNPEFSGRENVILAASVLGLDRAEIAARFESIVEFSGIRDFIDQPVKFYSSGMYVRLAFSVATSVDPDVLVIDEALSVGDGEFARKSFDRIVALKKSGVTLLFCSHALYQVEAFCDRVLWLEHGRTMMLGHPQEVIQRYGQFIAAGQTPAPVDAVAASGAHVPNATQPAAVAGYARITHAAAMVDDVAGRELRLRPGENTLAVRLAFESDPALPPPVIGVTLDYGTLLAVTCAVSRSDGVAVARDAAGRGEILLTFPELALRKGDYRVGVYLGCENALHIYDSVPQLATLAVEDARHEPGLVSLPHAWRSTPGWNEAGGGSSQHPGWRRAVLADGRALWVDAADSLGLAARGEFEPAESALCAALLRPGDRVLDVGANLGYYTVLCAERVGPTGSVDAVEPDPDNRALLDANTSELQAAGRVRRHALALSDVSSTTRLFRSKDSAGMHRLYPSVCCDGTAIEVEARRGDELGLAPLDFIKIDVEGFEPAALRGLEATLAQSPTVKILCEYSPLAMMEAGADPQAWLAWMGAQGFRPLAFDGGAWTEAACGDLATQAARLAQLDLAALTAPLRQADNATIVAKAEAAARAEGYTRPIVESLLFVRNGQSIGRIGGRIGAARPRWRVDWARPSDETALLALFARAFGHEMPPAQWRWKYAGLDPVGAVVYRDARPVAFYGGMPRAIRWFGAPATAVQIGDVMVDPVERGVLTRRGPFVLATRAFAERFVGPDRPYALAFGFPSERHTRLGERLGVYARVDEILEASWPALKRRVSLAHRARLLAPGDVGAVDELWRRMAERLTDVVVAVRDSAHIRHRFLEHPAAAYLAFLVRHRLTGAASGLVVLRDRGASGVELIDVVAPPEALATLIDVARRVAGRLGRPRVFGWMSPRAAESFAAAAPALAPAGIPVPTIIWSATPDLGRLRGRWWLLGGDADSR